MLRHDALALIIRNLTKYISSLISFGTIVLKRNRVDVNVMEQVICFWSDRLILFEKLNPSEEGFDFAAESSGALWVFSALSEAR